MSTEETFMNGILDNQPCYPCPSCGRIHYDDWSVRERRCITCGGRGTWGLRNGSQTMEQHASEIDRHKRARETQA